MQIKLHAFLTSTLDGSGQIHSLATLPLEEMHLLDRRLGG